MPELDGKVGFVSGGATGIGLACARAIVEAGGRVMLAARREDVLRDAAESLGEAAAWVRCDVTDEASVDAAVAATVERLGPLRLAVNSAASGSGGELLRTPAADFARALETDLIGVYRCLRAEARAMREAGGGSIVNISSIAGALTHPWMTSYCVSKAGVNMLTRCAADDLGAHGIRVNAVMPSLVDTPLVRMLTDDAYVRAEYLRRIPLGRLGRPEDVGRVWRRSSPTPAAGSPASVSASMAATPCARDRIWFPSSRNSCRRRTEMPWFALIGRDGPRGRELRRLHREAHLRGLEPLSSAGRVRHAGPLLDAAGEPIGSLVVFEAADREAAHALAAADPYVVEGVFGSWELHETRVVFPT